MVWLFHSSVKEPFSPGREAEGARPNLIPGEEWLLPPNKRLAFIDGLVVLRPGDHLYPPSGDHLRQNQITFGFSGRKFKCRKLRPLIFLQMNCLADPLINLLALYSVRNWAIFILPAFFIGETLIKTSMIF